MIAAAFNILNYFAMYWIIDLLLVYYTLASDTTTTIQWIEVGGLALI
jgi:hypothetical protein